MRLAELKSDIRELGYSVKESGGGLEVYDSLEGTKFRLESREEALRVGLRFFTAEAVGALKHPDVLRKYASLLTARPVGCRVEGDDAGGLAIHIDLPADQCDAEHIATVFSRIHLFEFTFSEALSRAGRTGRLPTNEEIDRLVAGFLAEANAQTDDGLVDPNDPDLYDEDDDDYEIDDDDYDY